MNKQEFDILYYACTAYVIGTLAAGPYLKECKTKKQLLKNIATVLFWFIAIPIAELTNLFNHWKNLPDE